MSIDPNPTHLVFKKVHFCCIRIFNNLPPSVTILKNNKAKFKAALRRYLHTHSFYSVDAFSFMSKGDL